MRMETLTPVHPERGCTWTLAARSPKVIHEDNRGSRTSILSFCLDDPEQGRVVVLPIFGVLEVSDD
jgi:hypothetical protein